jgi:hypothetical protein
MAGVWWLLGGAALGASLAALVDRSGRRNPLSGILGEDEDEEEEKDNPEGSTLGPIVGPPSAPAGGTSPGPRVIGPSPQPVGSGSGGASFFGISAPVWFWPWSGWGWQPTVYYWPAVSAKRRLVCRRLEEESEEEGRDVFECKQVVHPTSYAFPIVRFPVRWF